MISITVDPQNAERLILTQTVTLYLDRVLLTSLSAEVESAIREQSIKDLKGNKAVKRAIADATQVKLLRMLGIEPLVAGTVTPPITNS